MKNVIRKLIVPSLGFGLLFTGGATDAFASENVANNLSTIKPTAETSDRMSLSRDQFVQDTLSHAYYQVGQGKQNVMVFNLAQRYEHNLHGIQTFYTVNYGSITYGVWVFDSGYFQNKGDGGWINWAFQGSFDRNGGSVNFHSF